MRRLDVSVLFKVYCLLSEGKTFTGDASIMDYGAFSYSRWSEMEAIKGGIDRLREKASEIGFNTRDESGRIKILTADKTRLRKFFEKQVENMSRADKLSCAVDEDMNECTTLISFSKQKELFFRYLLELNKEDGESCSLIRMNLTEAIEKPYQRFCFEELIMDLEIQGILEIRRFDTKSLNDRDLNTWLVTPIVKVEFHPYKQCGFFRLDLIKNVVVFKEGVAAWSINGKNKTERAQAILLKTLIEARGEFIKTRDLGTVISNVVGGYGDNVSLIVKRFKTTDVRKWIKADNNTKRSRGYKIAIPVETGSGASSDRA